MVDIHTHLLYNVDDGSPSSDVSIEMLRALEREGVTDVFLTPHNCKVFHPSKSELELKFNQFKKLAKDSGCKANLFLGQEILLQPDFEGAFDSNTMLTLGDSKYILLEFDYSRHTDIPEIAYEFTTQGFIPIVVHVERYSYFDVDMARELKRLGGLIQVTADAIVGASVQYFGKRVKKLLKEGLVDFVSSDYHHNREICLDKAYKFVSKKYGEDYAKRIFTDNGKKIVDDILNG